MVNGQDWRIMGNNKNIPAWQQAGITSAKNLQPIVDEADSLMQTLGYSPAADFMLDIAGQETIYGQLPQHMGSLGITQVDAITYNDLVNDINKMNIDFPTAQKGKGAHAKKINEYIRSKGDYYKDFDITKLATMKTDADGNVVYSDKSKYHNDPLANFMLTRMVLSRDKKNKIPTSTKEKARVWKEFWNTKAGKGDPQEFIDKINLYRGDSVSPVDSTVDKHNKVSSAFVTQLMDNLRGLV
jgi:hypothetical protein